MSSPIFIVVGDNIPDKAKERLKKAKWVPLDKGPQVSKLLTESYLQVLEDLKTVFK